jgi:hypothetical protein
MNGVILVAAQRELILHVYHAFHHDLTIKLPSRTTPISQNTPQKHQQNGKNPAHAHRNFFPQKTDITASA